MIEDLAKQLSKTKQSIARDATMLGGARMILPAGLLACATALGLFVEAGSHSAQAYYQDGISGGAWSAAEFRPLPAAVYWDEPAYPQAPPTAIGGEIAEPVSEPTSDGERKNFFDLFEAVVGVGAKRDRSDPGSPAEGLPETSVAALGLDAPKSAPSEVDSQDEVDCLALNIYFEARNEPSKGQRAVAHVVMNRVDDPRFPDTVCRVVREGGERGKHRCQFSWWCDGLSDRPKNYRVWERALTVARDVYWGRSEDPTDGALWYHADYVMPYWGQVFERGPKIGRHIFYYGRKQRVQVAASQKAE